MERDAGSYCTGWVDFDVNLDIVAFLSMLEIAIVIHPISSYYTGISLYLSSWRADQRSVG
jgi:hypothetical protein